MRPIRFIHTLIMILALSLGASFAVAGDYVNGKPPSSFRGISWGTPISEASDLLPVKGYQYKDTYFRPNEKLTFGDAELLSVAYYFRKDKFYRVGVAFSGRANHFLLKDQLITMYGRGRGVGRRYGWMWPEFSVEITFDDETNKGALYYTYEGKLD